MNILFDKEDTKYNPIKKGNLYLCSEVYEFLKEEKNKGDFIQKMEEKDKDTTPREIILNKEEQDAYIVQYPSEDGDEGYEEGGEEEVNEGEC